jgi:hypothetical protein
MVGLCGRMAGCMRRTRGRQSCLGQKSPMKFERENAERQARREGAILDG